MGVSIINASVFEKVTSLAQQNCGKEKVKIGKIEKR